MNTFDKFKTKIKQVNIQKFNPLNKDNTAAAAQQILSDPDSQQSTEVHTG